MKILLGSKSPRRQELLKQLEIEFDVVSIDCDEDFGDMPALDVAEFLAVKKSNAYDDLKTGEILITADTTVVLGDEVLNKPSNEKEAKEMLIKLSNNTHEVVSGVCIRSLNQKISFSERTQVTFAEITASEMDHYISEYKPFDKAGSYGIQEWIGLSKITGISGCYYNVMGLPCARLYAELKKFYH